MSRGWMVSSLLVLAACGSAGDATGTGADPGQHEQRRRALKRVEPSAVALAPGEVQAFAVVPASTRVTWSVLEPGGGAITGAGLYTAPTTGGTYTVVATSVADPSVSRSAVVTVGSPVRITARSPISMDACTTGSLTATVAGAADTGVLWSLVDPACGTLTQAGAFTAARGNGTCVALAAARADPTQTAPVTLQIAERVLSVAVAPPAVTLASTGAQQFTATVTTTCGSFPVTP